MEIADLLAKQEIHELQMRFMRSMDRHDWETVKACFWPGAVHDHGTWRGPIDEFVEREKVNYAKFEINTHLAGNELIELDGDTATSELYSICLHRVMADGDRGAFDSISGMRFLDTLERRDGKWLISDRKVVLDWMRADPVTTADVVWPAAQKSN